MVLKLPWAQKRMFWAFENSIFQLFASFLVTKLKLFSGKGRQLVQIYLNQNFGIRTFLENGFGATLSSKANVVSVWKEHFPVFCKYLSEVVETIFRESEAKRSKLFKSKFGHRKLLRRWFWSYIELRNESCKRFWVTKLIPFSRKARECCKIFFDKVYFVESILESAFQS